MLKNNIHCPWCLEPLEILVNPPRFNWDKICKNKKDHYFGLDSKTNEFGLQVFGRNRTFYYFDFDVKVTQFEEIINGSKYIENNLPRPRSNDIEDYLNVIRNYLIL